MKKLLLIGLLATLAACHGASSAGNVDSLTVEKKLEVDSGQNFITSPGSSTTKPVCCKIEANFHNKAKFVSYKDIEVEVEVFNQRDARILHEWRTIDATVVPGEIKPFTISVDVPYPAEYVKWKVSKAVPFETLEKPDIIGNIEYDHSARKDSTTSERLNTAVTDFAGDYEYHNVDVTVTYSLDLQQRKTELRGEFTAFVKNSDYDIDHTYMVYGEVKNSKAYLKIYNDKAFVVGTAVLTPGSYYDLLTVKDSYPWIKTAIQMHLESKVEGPSYFDEDTTKRKM